MSWQHPKVLLISNDRNEERTARRVVTKALGPVFQLERVSGLEDALAEVDRGGVDVLLVGESQGGRTPAALKREATTRGCTTPMVLMTDPHSPPPRRDWLHRMHGYRQVHLRPDGEEAPADGSGYAGDEGDSIVQGLYDAATAAMGVVELVGHDVRGLSCNRTAAGILGIDQDEFEGRSLADLRVAPAWVARWTESLCTSAKSGQPFAIDYTTEGATRRSYHGAVSPLEASPGAPPRFGFVGFDVTEQKDAEKHVAELNSRLQRQVDQVHSLREIDRVIASGVDLAITLGVVLDQAIARLGAAAAAVRLCASDPLTLQYVAHRGFHASTVVASPPRVDEKSPAGRAVLDQRPRIVLDLRQSLDTPPESACAEGFLAYAAFPLVVRGEVRGLLEVGHRSPLAPDTDWVEFLEALAGQAAVAVDVASQAERQRRAHLELNTACDAAVEGWSRAMDLRDHEIEGHSRRVTDMTLRLARALGIGDDSLVQIRHGSLLHDIGKLVISDAILRKPGPLTDEEWVVMRTHPQRALEMLAPIPFLHAAMDIPFCHHELWDGSGYPRGLKGEQIPLAARIFTAVDIWDALSYDRPYRNAWPREQVEAHLRTLAGVHLDPAIAALLLRTLAAVADEARAATPEAPVLIEDPRR